MTDVCSACSIETDEPHTLHDADCRRWEDGFCHCDKVVCGEHCPDCWLYCPPKVDDDWARIDSTGEVPIVASVWGDRLMRAFVPASIVLLSFYFWRLW